MASYFWSGPGAGRPRAATATSASAPREYRPHARSVVPHSHGNVSIADEFDLIDDDIRLLLTSNRDGTRKEVQCKVSWGLYLRAILQEEQPIHLAFGTPEAHEVISSYFDEMGSGDAWEASRRDIEANPVLLVEVLEYAAGLQSMPVFREACHIFGTMFRSLVANSDDAGLSWPLDTSAKILKCGEKIRAKFGLSCEESMKSEEKCNELVKYFSAGVNVIDITHSTFRPVEAPTKDAVFNDALDKCDPFRQRDWQSDSEAEVCPSCKRQFVSGYTTFLTGVYASHCRVCGLRKCVNCTCFKVDKSIARLSKPGGPEEPQMRKACVDCYRKARNMQRLAFLGQAFVYAGLDIIQISMLRTVNQSWSMTAELILHGLRAAIYEFTTATSVHGVLAAMNKQGRHSIQPQHVLVDREPSHYSGTASKAASPEIARAESLGNVSSSSVAFRSSVTGNPLARTCGNLGSASPSPGRNRSTAAMLTPHTSASTANSRGKLRTTAVNASVRQLYQSSAKLLVGHPEHIIMLFLLLDWDQPSDVSTAVSVLQATTDSMSASLSGGSKKRSSSQRHPADDQNGPPLRQLSHWHLLCTRSCVSMPPAMFGVRMLDALQRGPPGCPYLNEATELVVSTLLKEPHHDSAIAAALVPLLLDLCHSKGTMSNPAEDVLAHLAATNPALGLQMIFDFRSREPPAIKGGGGGGVSDDVTHFAMKIRSEVTATHQHHHHHRHGASPRPLPSDEAHSNSTTQQLVGEQTQNHKFILAERFLDGLQLCMERLQKQHSVDEAKIKRSLFDAFTAEGLVKEIGGYTTVTTNTTESSSSAAPTGDQSAGSPPLQRGRSHSISSSASADAVPDLITTFPFMFPFDRTITIVGIQLRGVRVMSSKIRPVMIPLVDATNRVHRVLWKGEDMRQDYIVCLCGMRVQQILVEKGMYTDKNLVPHYRVLPLSRESGLIECVESSTSVQAIVAEWQATPSASVVGGGRSGAPTNSDHAASAEAAPPQPPPHSNALLAYLCDVSLKANSNRIKLVGKHFLTSAKFFILFNYLLNLRDRHRDNVMMTTDGCIFHIDFGMTRNQKTMAEEFTTSYVRFDGEVEGCIAYFMQVAHRAVREEEGSGGGGGGDAGQAETVKAFMKEVADWFCVIRPYAHDLYLLLRHVVAAKHQVPVVFQQSSVAFLSQSRFGPSATPAVASRPPGQTSVAANSAEDALSEVFLEEDIDLQMNLEDLFQRHLGESSARHEFVRRILDSRGKERVKDWTYETKKRTSGWLADVGARVMNVMYQQR